LLIYPRNIPIHKWGKILFREKGEVKMNVTANEFQAVIDSIQMSNDLLKMLAAAKLGIEQKMMKADVIANVAGIGEHIDVVA